MKVCVLNIKTLWAGAPGNEPEFEIQRRAPSTLSGSAGRLAHERNQGRVEEARAADARARSEARGKGTAGGQGEDPPPPSLRRTATKTTSDALAVFSSLHGDEELLEARHFLLRVAEAALRYSITPEEKANVSQLSFSK